MNDSRASFPPDFRKCVANQNSRGSHSCPHHFTVLNTVSAIAWPSTLRDAVPVAVIGPACGTLALKAREPKRMGRSESRQPDACAVGGVPVYSDEGNEPSCSRPRCLRLVVDQGPRELQSRGYACAANRRLGHTPGGVIAPDARGRLLERHEELSRFSQLIGESAGGSGRIAVIEGTAGIGKSRLLEAVCAQAKEAGLRVLFGRGGEFERDLGWRVVRELFEPALVTASESELRTLLSGAAGLAAPALGRDNGEAPQSRPDA